MELLIRTIDKSSSEDASKRGDVIAVMPDGWGWSNAERANRDWIIIHADITEIESGALLESYRPNEPKYKRRLGVNIDGLQPGDALTRDQLTARVF